MLFKAPLRGGGDDDDADTAVAGADVGGGVLNSSRDDRALMRVRTPRGLTRISREACCRVIGIKMANGASIKGLTDFRLLSRARGRRFDVFVAPEPADASSGDAEGGRVTRFHCAEEFSIPIATDICMTDRRSTI